MVFKQYREQKRAADLSVEVLASMRINRESEVM